MKWVSVNNLFIVLTGCLIYEYTYQDIIKTKHNAKDKKIKQVISFKWTKLSLGSFILSFWGIHYKKSEITERSIPY